MGEDRERGSTQTTRIKEISNMVSGSNTEEQCGVLRENDHHTSVDNEPLHPLGMTCPRGSGIPYFGVNLKLKVPAVSFGYDNDSQRNVNL